MQRMIKKNAPKHFDVVECTDSSITIKWDISDTAKCWTYKIYHRTQKTEKWNVKELSTEKIKPNKDGCNVYTLHDLSPETLYELRICSLDNQQVSSQSTETKLRQTLQIAPKNFDIVECTDSSITIKWDMDASDKRQAYKIDHRHNETEKWNVMTLSAENIKQGQDGCHMYKLQELSPETLYKLRMCSVDDQQVSSQYTETKLRHTLQIAPKNFDIVECTDTSITIKWDVDNLDKVRAYKIFHRHKKTEKWNVKELSTANIKPDQDGCHVYKLQELSAETLYELRICSLDNQQVISQFTESKMRQTLQIAPKNFDIVDCTDTSITIKWDVDDSDKRQAYKMYHRHKKTDNWNVKELSTENIKPDQDGCHVFKLQELSPETLYELRICSIDNQHVSSQCTETKLRQTLHIAPTNFDIVECTDTSITIQWDINDSDKRQGYNIYHRNIKTEKWNFKELSTENIKPNKDGCHVYKLQELSPETIYELKICSLDNQQVSSQCTESKIKQTLEIALPKAINQLQEEDKIRYIKIMQGSTTEKRYFVRIMIVGKGGVGKSCLLKRLLNESIVGVTSTDGLDIVVRRCKINIDDGKWIIDKVILDDTADRIKMAVMKDQNKSMDSDVTKEEVLEVSETYHQQVNAYSANSTNNKLITEVPLENQNDTYNNSTTSPSELELRTPKVDIMNASSTNRANDKEGKDSEYNVRNLESVTNTATKSMLTENDDSNNSKQLVMPSDLMSEVFTKTSSSDSPSTQYALCGLWDFAGQKEFYGTHQTFLTSSAIYLVVADMGTEICKEMTKELDETKKEIDRTGTKETKQDNINSFGDLQAGEYMDFWFDSIHCYRSANLPENNSLIDPPVIVVFTGKDKYEKKNLIDMKERQSKLDDDLMQLVADHKKYHHYRHKFYLSNTEDEKQIFQDIQDKISEIARKMQNWGEPVPLKWILLETLIDINKNGGKSFITLDEMIKLAKHPQIEIHDNQEVLLFLRFQHEVGKIIFFDDIKNLIILDPQWLTNAFRCLVSDRIDIIDKVEDKAKIQIALDMRELTKKGKISDLLIKTLFRLKGGNTFLNQMENLLKVMEKFDILVEFEGKHSYIMPSMMPSTSFVNVCKNIGIFQENCQRSSWFCLKFEFLPPTFFSHVFVWLMKKYEPSKFKIDKMSPAYALYRGFCVFDFEEDACDKLLMTMSTDTIALQVVSFHQNKELGVLCASVRKELIEKVKDIQKRYKLEVSYDEMFKCSDHSDAKSFDLMKKKDEIYCFSCRKTHISKTIYLPWIPECLKIETTPDVTFTLDLNQEYCIGEGETLQLKCSFVPDNINVKWLKNGEAIHPTDNVVIAQAERLHTLTIKYSYVSDSGQYSIAVGNVKKETVVNVKEMFTSVFDPAYYIIEGESLELKCSVILDKIHVKWFKDNKELHEYGNVSIDMAKRHYSFRYEQCAVIDSGQYSAVADNVRKQTIVLVKALFKRPLENKTITKGAGVTFECEVEKAYPAVWYKDNVKVTPSYGIKTETKYGTVYQLTIKHTSIADIGKYEIRMNNVHSSARLIVNGAIVPD